MTIQEIREQFFQFFASKGHEIVPSAPMVVKNDPTLMFTNAGMNQFKDYFLGNAEPKNPRVANTQKCLRVSGKHNDLEEVGVDTYHHTMFEMLGNWSFGDYFKTEAIAWAWELLTEIYKLPKDRLYVTVYEGDTTDGVPLDQESIDIWSKYITKDRIILADKKDNFWEMGESGPCGPCTEIHIDLRDAAELAKKSGRDMVNQDHPQVIEIWNNVFMQHNRKADGSLEKLKNTHVDTGMGLERLAMALQGKQSNYDTDLFQALISTVSKISGVAYKQSEPTDIALRVIADHVRAIAFSITDGQLPANSGAGYVIRRILRRAIRYGYTSLGLKEPFMCEVSQTLVKEMGDAFPELKAQEGLVYKVIKEEEISFFRTLELGLKRIDTTIADAKGKGEKVLDGETVFELFDTFGFPLDLTSLIARENDMSVNEVEFEKAMEVQKTRSRAATVLETGDWTEILEDQVEEFIGYDYLEADVQIVKYRAVSQKKKNFFQIVLNLTTFYPEGGGQVGDSGVLVNEQGEKIFIFDTKKENNLIVHLTEKLPENLTCKFKANVNADKRNKTALNHTATHLLHHALRKVLGEHVEQKGSLVNADYLRFDFSHFSKVTDEEMSLIQAHMDEAILMNIALNEERNIPINVAQEKGAMALFGEKYGDTVRMIQFGDSIELCGGTHASTTGKIALVKILSEGAVAAGVRRIEAITGPAAEKYFRDKDAQVNGLMQTLKAPKDLQKAVEDLLTKNSELQKEIDVMKRENAQRVKENLKAKVQDKGDYQILHSVVDLDAGSVKDLLFQFKGEFPNFVGIIGGKEGDKCSLSIMFNEDFAIAKDLNAGNIIREVSSHIQGGGGGQAFFATAGGKNANGLDKAIAEVLEKLK
ncbi:MAG: alanine--tRNA ligase [Crocinitomicaceae bacterium]|nr:alanine--tRNA ligase [Crocinitomicaceae bacterium]